MKAIIGFGFFLLFLAGLALVFLQGGEMSRQNLPGGGAGVAGTAWRPAMIGTLDIADDSRLFVQFSIDGEVSGDGGCNTFAGSLEATSDGLSVGPLATTRKACAPRIMQAEQAFLAAIEATRKFRRADGGLQLVGEGGDVLAELVAAD